FPYTTLFRSCPSRAPARLPRERSQSSLRRVDGKGYAMTTPGRTTSSRARGVVSLTSGSAAWRRPRAERSHHRNRACRPREKDPFLERGDGPRVTVGFLREVRWRGR